jgi:UDP-N-acetyl-D-mannosaminuronate dehydrogenase
MTNLGLNVEGFDLKISAIKRALYAKVIQKEARTFQEYDYYVVCVSTHNPENIKQPNVDSLLEIAERLQEEGALLSLESTVAMGTSSKINKILKHRLHVAHVPHRFYAQEKNSTV